MTELLAWLVPLAIGMGVVSLLTFIWSMKSGQLEDLDGASERVLHQGLDTPLQAQEQSENHFVYDKGNDNGNGG